MKIQGDMVLVMEIMVVRLVVVVVVDERMKER